MDSKWVDELTGKLRAAIEEACPGVRTPNTAPDFGAFAELSWIVYNVSVGGYGNPALWLGRAIARAEMAGILTREEAKELMNMPIPRSSLSVEMRQRLGFAGENIKQSTCLFPEKQAQIVLKDGTDGEDGAPIVLEKRQEVVELLYLEMYKVLAD